MNIIGNKEVTDFLEKSIKSERLAHAYIFNGPKQIGKRTTALWLAKKLLATENLETNPDFMHLDAPEGVIKKEMIDGVIARVRLSSFSGGYKVLIISNAHQMNISSANAFLKTLEEPSKKTIIILLTSELNKLLPTIISRSSVLHFKPVLKSEIEKMLIKKYNVGDTAPYTNLAFGRPGKAINMVENAEFKDSMANEVKSFYNIFFGKYELRFKAVKALLSGKGAENREILSKKIDTWLEIIRDSVYLKYKLNDLVAHKDSQATLEKLSQDKTSSEFAILGGRLLKMRRLLTNNINPTLLLENLII